MTTQSSREHPVNVALRRAHRSILVVLAASAVVIAVGSSAPSEDTAFDPPRGYVYAAVGLGVASILSRRRRPATSPEIARVHVLLSLASLLLAAGVGLIGVAASVAGTPRNAALLFVLAGGFFALRPPPPVQPPGPRDGTTPEIRTR
jgi:peptidoglycan/LPS O-acetylase OafA/YrhL